jgi:hypothetical protein
MEGYFLDGQYVKRKFKMDISTTLISTYKFTFKKNEPGMSGLVRVAEALEPASPGTPSAEITLDDIRAVKALADKIGAEKVKALAGVLGK